MGSAKFVQEGLAKLLIVDDDGGQSFYNPIMQFNRDLTITVLQQFVADREKVPEADDAAENGEKTARQRKRTEEETCPITILDALSASGLRAIRFAQEVPNVAKITANDFSEDSVKNIERNVKENALSDKIEVTCDDAKLIMMKHTSPDSRFTVVDLDPYGTAAPFLDSAVQSVAVGGLLMVTCTDMAVLCGNTPEASFAKYDSIALKHPSAHELALRILLRSIDSRANVYGRFIEPLLAVSVDYYIRVFVKIHYSPAKTKLSAAKVAHVLACTGCKAFEFVPLTKTTDMGHASFKFTPSVFKAKMMNSENKCTNCDSPIHIGGPVYSAAIQDGEFVSKLLKRVKNTSTDKQLGTHDRLLGMLTVISEEFHEIPLYLTQDIVMTSLRVCSLKQTAFRSIFLNAGYKICGTHCNPKGFKTDAPWEFVFDIPRSLVGVNKVESLSNIGKAIVAKGISHTIDQKFHQASVPSSLKLNLVRYQCNHGKNWGPKSRAKGSISSHVPHKKARYDDAITEV